MKTPEIVLRKIENRAKQNRQAEELGLPPAGNLLACVAEALAQKAALEKESPEVVEELLKEAQQHRQLDQLAATINGRQ